MGFLSGVLGAVKDDDAVKTYDNYMDKKLSEVLKELNTKIGTGRNGLAASVAAVKEWLEGYEGELKSRTNNVIGELGKLIHDKIGQYAIHVVSGSADKKLQDQLAAWTSVLGSISDAVQTVETNVNMLDSKLKNDVMHEISVIHSSVAMLKQSSGNNELIQAVNETVKKFDATRKEAEEAVTEEAKKVIQSLRNKISALKAGNRKTIESIQIKVVNDMEDIVESAQSSANAHLDTMDLVYRDRITKAHSSLKNAMGRLENHSSRENLLYMSIDELQKKFDKLKGEGDSDGKGTLETTKKTIKNVLQQLIATADTLKNDIENNIKAPLDMWLKRNETDGIAQINKNVSKHVKSFQKEYAIINRKLIDLRRIVQPMENSIPMPRGMKDKSFFDGFWDNVKAELQSIPDRLKIDMETLKTKIKNPIVQCIEGFKNSHGIYTILRGYPLFLDSAFEVANKALKSDEKEPTDNVFYKVSVVKEEFMKSFIDVNKQIVGAIKDIEREVGNIRDTSTATNVPDKTLMALVTNLPASMGSLSSSIKHVIDVVKGANERIAKTVELAKQLYDASEKEYASRFDNKFQDLKSEVQALELSAIKQRLQEAVRSLNAHLGALESVPDDVDRTDSGPTRLKGKLGQEIDSLKKEVKSKIEIQAASLTTSVNGALTNAETDAEQFINKLSDEYKKRLKEGIDALEQQVQKMFAEQHETDLKSLKTLAMRQEERIGRVLSDDKKTGLKGLLCLFNKKLTLLNHTYFPSLVSRFQHFYDQTHTYVEYQIRGVDDADPDSQPQTPDPLAALLVGLTGKVDKLLSKLELSGHFDYEFRQHLNALECALQTFTPSKFGGPCTVLLDVVKGGAKRLAGELDKAYVSRYSGIRYIAAEEPKYAKVLFSMLHFLFEDLSYLKKKCESGDTWKHRRICETEGQKQNPLGKIMRRCGFIIPTGDGSKQDGELQCSTKMMGGHIVRDLLEKTHVVTPQDHIKTCVEKGWNYTVIEFLKCLTTHFDEYNRVCHLSTLTSKKHPCTVYEMLNWLNGLTHNPVHDQLSFGAFTDLFDKPEETATNAASDDLPVENLGNLSLNAYPEKITVPKLTDALGEVCYYSHGLLITIAGTGDAHTVYASDYSNNSLRLYYPQRGEDCLDMLLDILRRLFPPLKFLLSQCGLGAENYGWADCSYGKGISSGKSQCTDHITDEPTCQPKDQPTCQPNCQPTSPLMSYLNDCLPGHLPHNVNSIGCRSVCSNCPKSLPGQPCLTPLGFRGFSGCKKTGRKLCAMLTKFFENGNVASLFCLYPKPPSTLPEHFGFALSLVGGWLNSSQLNANGMSKYKFQQAVDSSISGQSIGLYSPSTKLTDALISTYGSDYASHMTCEHPHLLHLTRSEVCSNNGPHCAPYLSTLSSDYYTFMANKHSDVYLSWAVYVPWTFHRYLESLLSAFCNIFCQDWGCSRCLHGNKCQRGKHGLKDEETKKQYCKCTTIVNCRGALPTLYSYGFCYSNAAKLLAAGKSCFDFQKQLYDIVHSQFFTDLFNKCDEFIFTIRQPFIWLNVALWSLSLFYLICVMVGRLDVLHIRSHLRIPSSHKITAQSLLAAAQVGRLAKISYLQP